MPIICLITMINSTPTVTLSARSTAITTDSMADPEENKVYHISASAKHVPVNTIKYQAKNILFRDLTYLTAALIVISIDMRNQLVCNPSNCQCSFTIFKIIFELCSAYGTGMNEYFVVLGSANTQIPTFISWFITGLPWLSYEFFDCFLASVEARGDISNASRTTPGLAALHRSCC